MLALVTEARERRATRADEAAALPISKDGQRRWVVAKGSVPLHCEPRIGLCQVSARQWQSPLGLQVLHLKQLHHQLAFSRPLLCASVDPFQLQHTYGDGRSGKRSCTVSNDFPISPHLEDSNLMPDIHTS